MQKSKLIFITVLSIVFIATLVSYFKVDSIEFEQKFRAYTAWFNPTEENINNFNNVSTSAEFVNNLALNPTSTGSVLGVFDSLRTAQQATTKNVYAIGKDSREAKVPIDFTEVQGVNLNLPEKIQYIIPGSLGYEVYSYDLVLFSPNKDTLSSKYLNLRRSTIEPLSRKIISGTASIEDSKTTTLEMFESKVADLKSKSETTEIFENISVNSISFIEMNFAEQDLKNNKIPIGNINIHLENCFKDFNEELSFNVESNEIEFSDSEHFVKKLCKKQFTKENGVLVGTCIDCTYYPADKIHALRSDYEPELAAINFAPGGQSISVKAYQDFMDLYNSAKNDGIYITVTSGFRSYQTQVATFYGWVQAELAFGHSQSEAEAIANTYSALPGFSEHQLGTALDLNGAGCGISDGGCSSNSAVWSWLANNAYKFGFVQSYPDGKQPETGYTTEDWHYRWIGKDYADEYVKAGGGTAISLNKFLLEKGNF